MFYEILATLSTLNLLAILWNPIVLRELRAILERRWTLQTIENDEDGGQVSIQMIKRHLEKLYFIMVGTSASAALGLHLLGSTGEIGDLVAEFGTFVCLIWFYVTAPWRTMTRICSLMAGAFLGGAYFGQRVAWFLDLDPIFVVYALLALSVVHAVVAVASRWFEWFDILYCSRRFITNPLVLVNLHYRLWDFSYVEPGFYKASTATIWFLAYMAVYNLEVVRKLRGGDEDYVNHAVTILSDSPVVCFQIVNIMTWEAWMACIEIFR